MDLLYLSDSITYQSRVYTYGVEDQSWVNINDNETAKPKNKRDRNDCGRDQKHCSICKHRQKRTLSNYILKTRRDSDKDTFIEEEEEEEEEGDEKTPKTQEHASKSQEKPSTSPENS